MRGHRERWEGLLLKLASKGISVGPVSYMRLSYDYVEGVAEPIAYSIIRYRDREAFASEISYVGAKALLLYRVVPLATVLEPGQEYELAGDTSVYLWDVYRSGGFEELMKVVKKTCKKIGIGVIGIPLEGW